MAKEKKYAAVKLNIQMNIMASEDMVKRLEDGEAISVVLNNCFNNNTRGIENVSHDIIKQSEDWNEIKDLVLIK